MSACERLRKLLSQLPASQVSVENMSDDYGDETLHFTREELAQLCEESLMTPLQNLILAAIAQAGLQVSEIFAVEVLGGGMRMPIVQSLVLKLFSSSGNVTSLGAKFDDSSLALGAALLGSSSAKGEVSSKEEKTDELSPTGARTSLHSYSSLC